MKMTTIIMHSVYVYGKEWRLTDNYDQKDKIKLLNIKLEILGEMNKGFHLCSTADGCNTYDSWFETVEEAIADALENYKAPVDGWTIIE